MPVVINELEVAPQPAAPQPQGQTQQSSAPTSPELLAMMDKMLHAGHRKNYRLEAY